MVKETLPGVDGSVLKNLNTYLETIEAQHKQAKEAYKRRITSPHVKDMYYTGLIWKRSCKVLRGVYYLRHMLNVRERHRTVEVSPDWDTTYMLRTLKSLFGPVYVEALMEYLKGE